MIRGKPNKVMAADLGVSQRTVEIHRARVMEKTGAASLAQLVRMAMDLESQAPSP
jgi:FixJ family two-component response regulator